MHLKIGPNPPQASPHRGLCPLYPRPDPNTNHESEIPKSTATSKLPDLGCYHPKNFSVPASVLDKVRLLSSTVALNDHLLNCVKYKV